MKKELLKLSLAFCSMLSMNIFAQTNITYVTFPSGINSVAALSTLYNTQNTRNDSMLVQLFNLSDFSLGGSKQINSIKGRFINPSSTPGNIAQADLVIYDKDANGKPGNLLFSTTINVSNSDNGDGSTHKDITTTVSGVVITDNFFAGIRTKGSDIVQFSVGFTGCACDNAWLYGPSAINAGDDSWRTLRSRHASQDLNFYFEVNITDIVAVNQSPATLNDDVTTAFDTQVDIDVLSNDSDDVSLNPASVSVTIPSVNGTTSVNTTTGVITFTPTAGFSGTTTFTYQVCDNGSPALCSTATVTITVNPAVVVNQAPTTTNDVASTAFNTPVVINVLANDTDDVSLNVASLIITTQPANGTVSINGSDVTYTPNAGFSGVDGFSYQVCDNGTPVLCSTNTLVGITVGVNSIGENTIISSVYPNPVIDVINIKSTEAIKEIKITNIEGKVIANFKSSKQVNVSSLNSGVYFLELTFENGNVSKNQFVKN